MPKRSDGIDLLRSLAILLVLLNHVNVRLRIAKVPYLEHLPSRLGHTLAWNGQSGVQIFFAISGFLIMSTSLHRWGTSGRVSPAGFYRLRFARIAPLLLTLLAILSLLHTLQLPDFIVRPKFGGLGPALWATLTFRSNLFEADHGYLPGNWDILWSLSVEEMFYLAFPLVCALARPKWMLGTFLVVVVCQWLYFGNTAYFPDGLWREYSYSGGMCGIALGCLTALYAVRIPKRPRLFGCLGFLLVGFVLVYPSEIYRMGLESRGLDRILLSLGACAAILAATQSEWQSPRWFNPFLTLGKRSYEIYLSHMFIVFACFHAFLNAGKPLAAVPLYFLAVILLSTALGEIIGRYFSEPANQRLRSRTTG